MHSQQRSALPAGSQVALLGPPGAGKTTVGRQLAARLEVPFIDVDDDVLQPAWSRSVSSMLSEIGPTEFLEKEGETSISHKLPQRFVLALSGSNPMYERFMEHLSSRALLVYLDVDHQDIIARLGDMNVRRIVGGGPSATMESVLRYREEFYERFHHLRVLCGSGDNVERITARVLDVLTSSRGLMHSSRSGSESVSFAAAMRTGLARDGGLFTPHCIPRFDREQWLRLVPMSFAERCLRVMQPWIDHTELSVANLRRAITAAYDPKRWSDPGICPVLHLENRTFVQELFHGPTASFKDLALSLMAECLPHLNPQPQLMLVATSGDTGSAVLNAFARKRWPTVILYPRDGVSAVQRLCMTQYHNEEEGRLVCGLAEDFDACQSLVKTVFRRPQPSRALLNGANSINWGRLLPQVAFHCSAYLELVRQGRLRFGEPLNLAIPSGNFGNALSAFYAKLMGLPLGRILCANNENSALADFLTTGRLDLRQRTLIRTVSPAIDILQPSNIERLIAHVAPSAVNDLYAALDANGVMQVSTKTLAAIREHFIGVSVTHESAMASLVDVYKRCRYLLDPHTAVAAAACPALAGDEAPILLNATAHPAKFAETVVAVVNGSSTHDPHRAITEVDALSRGKPRPHPALKKLPAIRHERLWRPEEVLARVDVALEQLETSRRSS